MATKSVFQKVVILTVIASFLVWNVAAVAAPEGGQVAAGNAAITQSGTTTTINQSSQNTVLNWQGFNTTANEAVKFIQPNASSIALNRITSGLPTSYAGQLTANGQVWILNPAGVLFTSTSKIDVGGLVATTLSIKDSDFMNKNYKLSQAPGFPQGSVVNYGSITSHENGLVALVAPTVENHGTIVANVGNVLLASGTVATLDPYGDNLINFAPDNYAIEGSVTNTGTITTNGGKVVMAANSVNNIVKNVVNAGGIIEAKNIRQGADGVIILGGNSGVTSVTGKITSNKIMIKGYDTKIIEAELKSPDVGFIETSGEKISISSGTIIEPGKGGLWYLDPLTINISDYAGLVQSRLQAGINVSLSTGTNLSIAGTGDINVDQAISWNTGAILYLAAYRDINVSQPFSSTGGQVYMRAGMANNGTGNVVFSGAAAVAGANVMNGGNVGIYYNPSSYSAPTNYQGLYFSGSTPVTSYMMIHSFSNLLSVAAVGSPNTAYNYSLTTDIDISAFTDSIFGPNSSIYGVFSGYDFATGITHTLSNANVDLTALTNINAGVLAGFNYGTISSLNIQGNISANDQSDIGGFVGQNLGVIYNVGYTGSVTSPFNSIVGGIAGYSAPGSAIILARFSGQVIAGGTNNSVGGIVGVLSDATLTQSSATGGGLVFGGSGSRTGGLVGDMFNNSTISNSYSEMTLNGVLDPSTTGGLVGRVVLTGGSGGIATSYTNGAVTFGNMVIGSITGSGGFGTGDVYYNADLCVGCTTPGVGALTTAQMNVAGNFGTFNFTNIWTTNGNTTPPRLIALSLPVINTVLGSGTLSVASSQAVSIYANGILQSTVNSNASGGFVFSYDPNIDFASLPVLATTNAAVKGTILKTAPSTTPLTGLNIANNLVLVSGGPGLSNADLAAATVNVPYSASGNNLTLSSGVDFRAEGVGPYTLDGNITTSGGLGMAFISPVSLATNSILTSSGVINIFNTVDGAFALTANASGAVMLGDDMGGTTPLTSLTVSSNGPITQGGFIKVTGASSFSAGANAITLTDLGNVFGGAVTLSNSGANDVQIYNNAPLSLSPFNIGGNLTVTTSGGNITLTGTNTSGSSQTYNGPVVLGAATVLNSGGVIDFNNTLNGAFSLTTTAVTTSFDGVVGGITPLASLIVNGGVTQSARISVTGTSMFNTGANAIDLSNPANSFGGAISLNTTGSNDATLTNSVATVLAVSSVGGALVVTSNGPISQTGLLTVGGASSFSAGANGINLNLANILTGPVNFTNTGAGNNVTLNNTTALILGTSSTGGNLIVTSNGNPITQAGPLSVGGTSSFTAGAAAIILTNLSNNLQGQVTVFNTGANDVQIYNDNVLDLAPFTVGGNLTVGTNGSNIILQSSSSSGGSQTYNAPIVLASATNLLALAGNIDFTDTIAGAGFNLATDTAPGFDTQIHGDITNVNMLYVLGDVDINANVSTLGAQTYNGVSTLTTDVNLNAATGNINFISAVNGAGFDLSATTASPFATVFDSTVSNVDVLSVTGTADINGGSIATLGAQLYNGLVNLGANTDLASAGGNIEFFNIVDAMGFDLTTHTVDPYSTIFHNNLTNVNNLTVDGEVTFMAAVVVTATGTASFNDALNGPGSLTLTAANTLISGTEGGVPPLSFLTINGPVSFNGGVINANAQTYNGLVTVLSSLNPTEMNASGLIHFLNDVEGPGGLILVAGGVQFDGDVGGITELSLLDMTAPVTFTGSSTFNAAIQNYRGPVTISGAGATINGSGSVNFFDTVDGPGSLTVDAPVTQFSGIVGGTSPLNILTILNDVILNGVTIYANQQIYQGPATIGGGGATLVSPDVQFLSTIMGSGALSIIGNLTASDDINIGRLNVTGTTLYNKGTDQNITTVNGQNYGDTVTLNNNLNILNTGFGYINFGGGGVYGPTFDLSVVNMSGTVTNGITGSVNVNSLTLGGTGGANLTNSFFNSLNYAQLSIGSFCVNGSCEAISLNGPEAQRFILPANNMVCDASGCRNAYIEINDSYLLRAFDPLHEICVVAVDGTVSCLGDSEEKM